MTFHNGDPFTAEDVKFSFLRYKGTSAKLLHDKVKAVEVLEAHRLRFVLHALWPDFLTFYATPATGGASCCNNAPYLPGRADGGAHCAPLHLRCALTFWNI